MKNWKDHDSHHSDHERRGDLRISKAPRKNLRPLEEPWETDWRAARDFEAHESELKFERASSRMPVR